MAEIRVFCFFLWGGGCWFGAACLNPPLVRMIFMISQDMPVPSRLCHFLMGTYFAFKNSTLVWILETCFSSIPAQEKEQNVIGLGGRQSGVGVNLASAVYEH